MRNQLVLCWSGSPSAFGYRMGWLRALLGQKLRFLSRSFAALFILFVRFGYPIQISPGAFWQRYVLTMLVHNPIQAQECRSIDTMVTKAELLKDNKQYGTRYAHPRFPKSMDIPICKSSTNSQEVNMYIWYRRSIRQLDC